MLLTAKYVLPISANHIEDGAVLVRGDRIEAVWTQVDMAAAYPD